MQLLYLFRIEHPRKDNVALDLQVSDLLTERHPSPVSLDNDVFPRQLESSSRIGHCGLQTYNLAGFENWVKHRWGTAISDLVPDMGNNFQNLTLIFY